jgi:hypothetical protein
MGRGMGKTVVLVLAAGGGGRTKQVGQHACEHRKTGTHTHTGHRNGPGGHESSNWRFGRPRRKWRWSSVFGVLRALMKGGEGARA